MISSSSEIAGSSPNRTTAKNYAQRVRNWDLHLMSCDLGQRQEYANWMASIGIAASDVRADWVAPPTQACKRWPAVTTGTRRSGLPEPPCITPRKAALRACARFTTAPAVNITSRGLAFEAWDSWRNSKWHCNLVTWLALWTVISAHPPI